METNLFPGIFSSDFVISEIEAARLKPTIELLRSRRILPRSLAAPIFILWDLTYRCNLCCGHCYNGSSPRNPTAELGRDQLYQVAEELVRMQVFSVCLSGGEPRLRDEFFAIAEYLRDRGIAVSTITNGCDLSDDTIEGLARTMAVVQVSLEGATAGSHDRLRGKNSFAKAVAAIERMRKAGVRQIRVASVATRTSVDEFPALLDLCLELGVDDLRSMPLVPIGRALSRDDLRPTAEQCEWMREQVQRWTQDPATAARISVEWGDPVQHLKLGLLYGFVLGINITADGYYRFSPYLNVAMGNVRDMSLSDAWSRGLCVAWKHPVVASQLGPVADLGDFAQLFSGEAVVGQDECLDLFKGSPVEACYEACQ